mgnify:CR=1 FL=1
MCGLDGNKSAVATHERNFTHPVLHGDITKDRVKTKFVELVKKELKGKNKVKSMYPAPR